MRPFLFDGLAFPRLIASLRYSRHYFAKATNINGASSFSLLMFCRDMLRAQPRLFSIITLLFHTLTIIVALYNNMMELHGNLSLLISDFAH